MFIARKGTREIEQRKVNVTVATYVVSQGFTARACKMYRGILAMHLARPSTKKKTEGRCGGP